MNLDVLAIAPHPDDVELGMAGAILKFKSEGLAVGVLDLTNGEPTPHGSPEIRAQETAAATEILRARLERESRSPQSVAGGQPGSPPRVGQRHSASQTTVALRSFLG